MSQTQNPLNSLIGQTLARRKSDPRFRSSVARGLDHATEHYAYPWVLGFVDDPRHKTAYLRAAGLAAAYPDVKHGERIPLGASLKKLSISRSKEPTLDPAKPDLIASRLTTFHEQDLEAAVSTIRRFLDLARDTEIIFDFYAISGLITRWGSGFTDASQSIRTRTIGDYYGAWSNDNVMPADSTNTNQER